MRFDDITPKMNWERFKRFKSFIDSYDIKSILGVIPDSKDKSLDVSIQSEDFIQYLLKCKNKGDVIAQHGYNHLYDKYSAGYLGIPSNSEFAGHSYKDQYSKILKGKKILESKHLWQPFFMAPSHSFDETTLLALKKLGFEYITDGISLFPYTFNGLTFIPQFYSKPLPIILPCLSQLCIHINTISEKDLNYLKLFIQNNYKRFVNIEEAIKLKTDKPLVNISRYILDVFVKNYKTIKSRS